MPLEPLSPEFDVDVDWDEIPDSDLLADGNYELVVLKADGGWTASNKLACELTFQVGAGPDEGKRMRPQNYTLGSDTDPQAMEPQTKKEVFGWSALKRVCNATGVRFEQSLRAMLRQLEGHRFVATVKVQTQPDKNRDGTPNQYAGNQQNRITAYYPLGSTPATTAPQALAAGRAANGNGPETHTPQRRLSMTEAMAQQRSENTPTDHAVTSADEDIPF